MDDSNFQNPDCNPKVRFAQQMMGNIPCRSAVYFPALLCPVSPLRLALLPLCLLVALYIQVKYWH